MLRHLPPQRLLQSHLFTLHSRLNHPTTSLSLIFVSLVLLMWFFRRRWGALAPAWFRHFQPNFTPPKLTISPLAVLNKPPKMRVPYELKQGQNRVFHRLPSGLSLEVIEQKKRSSVDDDNEKAAVVFVHGSYHAAWCFAENWLPFFADSGFDCYALSLLGQGESDAPSGSAAGTLQAHAGDIADFIQKNLEVPPVLVGHSIGGLIIQSYIANIRNEQLPGTAKPYPELSGAVLVCSVPPTGNNGLVWRYIFSKPIAAFKVTRSLAAMAFQTDLSLCKETFFSSTMGDHLVKRYQELMKESSRMKLFDLRKLNASLPVPSVPKSSIDVLVIGAKDDFIVDEEGLNETGRFYGVKPICVEGVAHDMMLDCSWEKGANVVLSWLNNLSKKDKHRVPNIGASKLTLHIPEN